KINFHFVAHLVRLAAGARKLAQRHAAFRLQSDVDDGDVLLDRDDGPLDDGTLLQVVTGKRLFEHLREIFAGGLGGCSGHWFSGWLISGLISTMHAVKSGARRLNEPKRPPDETACTARAPCG